MTGLQPHTAALLVGYPPLSIYHALAGFPSVGGPPVGLLVSMLASAGYVVFVASVWSNHVGGGVKAPAAEEQA